MSTTAISAHIHALFSSCDPLLIATAHVRTLAAKNKCAGHFCYYYRYDYLQCINLEFCGNRKRRNSISVDGINYIVHNFRYTYSSFYSEAIWTRARVQTTMIQQQHNQKYSKASLDKHCTRHTIPTAHVYPKHASLA